MKRLFLITLVLFFSPVVKGDIIEVPHVVNAGMLIGSGAGGGAAAGYSEEVTDDHSGPNTPPSGWTEESGSWTETAGGVLTRDADQANAYIRYSTAVSGVDHYFCATMSSVSTGKIPGIAIRMQSTQTGSNYFYIVRNNIAGTDLDFRTCYDDGVDANCNTWHDETSYVNWSSSDIICFGVEGTGADTIFHFWQNPADDPPEKSDTDYSICSSGSCGGGNNVTWDNTPDTSRGYANVGTYGGIVDMDSNNYSEFDNFKGGSE